jgi:hypothetical protein
MLPLLWIELLHLLQPDRCLSPLYDVTALELRLWFAVHTGCESISNLPRQLSISSPDDLHLCV